MSPVLSIVIANYNYGVFLEDALRSVFRQGVDGIELIVVDGGSTDDSVEIIRKYADKIAWWCSEPDNGQTDAFIKGFSHAHGKYLIWLNADDMFVDGALKRFMKAAGRHPECEWFVGGCIHANEKMEVVRCTRARPFSQYEADHGQICVYSPSSFFARSLYNRVGGMDPFFHYSMDTDLWCKFYYQQHIRYRVMPGYLFAFRIHGGSKTMCVNAEKMGNGGDKNIAAVRPDYDRGRIEHEMIRSAMPPCPPMSNVMRLLRTNWWLHFRSLIDTLRWRGHRVNEAV